MQSMLDRLHAARAALGGTDLSGRRIHASMFDPDVLSLAHGDGTRRPHPAVIAAGISALLETERGSLDDYLFMQRHEEFEAAVAADFERHGIMPEIARNVCVDSGTTRLFDAFLQACSEPGDVFLVPRSHYHPLPSWCDLHSVEPALVDTQLAAQFKLTAADIDAWYARNEGRARRVRGLFLFNPTQTGALYSEDELRSLAKTVDARGLWVLEDSVFAGTEFPGEPPVCHLSAAAPGIAERVVTLRGASKAFNLANIRIGWGCGPQKIISQMNNHTMTTLATVPYLAKEMALAALRAPRDYLLANASECAARVGLLSRLVENCNQELGDLAEGPVLEIPCRPQAGHGLLLSAPGLVGLRLPGGGQVRTSLDITRYLLEAARVAVSPGYSLGFDGTELRLAFGSVGLKHTYPGVAGQELAAALAGIAAWCGRSGSPASTILSQAAALVGGGEMAEDTEIFQAGRDLLSRAFNDRMLPAFARLLASNLPSRRYRQVTEVRRSGNWDIHHADHPVISRLAAGEIT